MAIPQIRLLRTHLSSVTIRLFSATASKPRHRRPHPPPSPPQNKHRSPPPPPSPAAAKRNKGRPAAAGKNNKGRPAAAAEVEEDAGSETEWKPLYRRLSKLGGASQGAVTKTLNNWVKEKGPVKAMRLMLYVKELRRHRRYSHALEVMDWMENKEGMSMSHTNHAIRLDLISKVKGAASAEKYFASLPREAKNERTCGALLNSYCWEKMEDKAIALYEKMKLMNFSNTLLHNNLMVLYMKLDHPEKVPIQFHDMKAQNIAPDNLTCSLLMRSYASMKDIDSVGRVIQEIEEGGEVTLQWSAYSTLASIYSSAGLFRKAESALKKLERVMDRRKLEPFHYLISLYAGVGNLREVHRMWKFLKTHFPKPYNMSYLTMLLALKKLDDIDGMKQCYDEWSSIQTAKDPRLTNVMLNAYLQKDMIEEAQSLSKNTSKNGEKSDSRTCELYMDFFLRNGEISLALKWLESAATMRKGIDWKFKDDMVKAFIEGFEKSKDVEGAKNFLKSLKRLECVDSEIYESLVQGTFGDDQGSN